MMRAFVAAAAALMVLAGCAPSGPNPAWPTFQNEFIEGFFTREPSFAASQGRHEFDGRLPDWSEEGLADHIAFLKSAIEGARL